MLWLPIFLDTGFSGTPVAPFGPQEYAAAFLHLMDQLGYERFVLYSTDSGSTVALHIIESSHDRVINRLTDFYLVQPNSTDLARYAANKTTPEESRYIESLVAFQTNHSAMPICSPRSHSQSRTRRTRVLWAFSHSGISWFTQ